MNSREWLISHDVDSSKAMCDALDQALKELAEKCAVDAIEAFQEADTMAAIPNAIMRACLNATGESDDYAK